MASSLLTTLSTLLVLLLGACGDDVGVDDTGTAPADTSVTDSGADTTSPADTSVMPPTDTGTMPPPDTAIPPGRMPIVVAVGWQGLRLLSIDEGLSWCETGLMVDGHDDLFRGAGYHDGLYVGAHAGEANRGAIWTTTNGYEWTALHKTNEEPTLPDNPSGQWYGGAAWGNGIWMAGGGCGRLATSVDGATWTEVPRFTDGCLHIRSMAFGDGLFVAGLDDDNWYSSADGVTWEVYRMGAGSFVVALESGLSGPVDGRNYYQGRGVCLAGMGSPDFGVMRSEAADCSGGVRVADTAHRPTTFLFGDAPEEELERSRMPSALADCLGLP